MAESDQVVYSTEEVELAHYLTKWVAPNEFDFFDEIIESSQRKSRKTKDRALGFGVSIGELASVSTALVVICKPVVQFLWENSKDSAQGIVKDGAEAAREKFSKVLKAWTAGSVEAKETIKLGPAKINVLLKQVEEKARAIGLSDENIEKIREVLKSELSSGHDLQNQPE